MKKDYLTSKKILISTVGVITIVIILSVYLLLPSYPTFAEFLEDYKISTFGGLELFPPPFVSPTLSNLAHTALTEFAPPAPA